MLTALFKGGTKAAQAQGDLPFTLEELIIRGCDEEIGLGLKGEVVAGSMGQAKVYTRPNEDVHGGVAKDWHDIAWARGFISEGRLFGFRVQHVDEEQAA